MEKENKVLLCNMDTVEKVNCTNINEFNIEKAEFVEKLEDNDVCFYNEQIDSVDGKNKVITYYRVSNGRVIEPLGNRYMIGD